MIKVCKYFYIHWLFLVLVAFSYINRQLENLFVGYLIISVHELSHLFSAKCMGLTLSHIVLYPFGLNLKLKNTMLYSISDEIILYMSGPVSNIIMALLSIPFLKENPYVYRFYYMNLSLFIINMLPVMPLDGGMVLKKLLNYRYGYDLGNKIMKTISFLMIFFIVFITGVMIYNHKVNPTVYIFMIFVIGNILVSREKYNKNLIKELVYCREKKNRKKAYDAKIIGCCEGVNPVEILKKFNQKDRYFVVFTDSKKHPRKIMSEEELIENVLEKKKMNF